MPKLPIYRGQYHVQSRRMRHAATADPDATCWIDGLTLAQHPGQHWTCGHVTDLDRYRQHPSPHAAHINGKLCAPQASGCNYGHHERTMPQGQATTKRW